MGVATLEQNRVERLEELCKNSFSPCVTDKQLSKLLSNYRLNSAPLIKKSREQVKRTHSGQLRDDGKNVIYQHINWVAYKTIEFYIDHNNFTPKTKQDLIILSAAGLLHDIVEVDPYFFNNPNRIEDEFGAEVSHLVMPVTRLYWKNFNGRTKAEKKIQAEITYRNNLLNAPPGSKLIKSIDRLNNTLSSIALFSKLYKGNIDPSFYKSKVRVKNECYINDGEFYINLASAFPELQEQIKEETKKLGEYYGLFRDLYHKKRMLSTIRKLKIPVVQLYKPKLCNN